MTSHDRLLVWYVAWLVSLSWLTIRAGSYNSMPIWSTFIVACTYVCMWVYSECQLNLQANVDQKILKRPRSAKHADHVNGRGGGLEEIRASTMDYFVRPFIIPPVCPFVMSVTQIVWCVPQIEPKSRLEK